VCLSYRSRTSCRSAKQTHSSSLSHTTWTLLKVHLGQMPSTLTRSRHGCTHSTLLALHYSHGSTLARRFGSCSSFDLSCTLLVKHASLSSNLFGFVKPEIQQSSPLHHLRLHLLGIFEIGSGHSFRLSQTSTLATLICRPLHVVCLCNRTTKIALNHQKSK
jgi:hypothetical protein